MWLACAQPAAVAACCGYLRGVQASAATLAEEQVQHYRSSTGVSTGAVQLKTKGKGKRKALRAKCRGGKGTAEAKA